MYNQLIDYTNTHKTLSRKHLGVKEGYSTQLVLILLIGNISQAIDKVE